MLFVTMNCDSMEIKQLKKKLFLSLKGIHAITNTNGEFHLFR